MTIGLKRDGDGDGDGDEEKTTVRSVPDGSDNYIQIVWQNVQGGRINENFWKYGPFESNYFGLPYDYLSVMHYRETDASKNGGVTIQTRDQRFQKIIGKSPGVSRGDVRLIKKMYHCN